MTRSKFEHPRFKVRARIDYPGSLVATISEKITHTMRLPAGDSIEWIWITEGFESYVKVNKVQLS
jgi:hypothetical protein